MAKSTSNNPWGNHQNPPSSAPPMSYPQPTGGAEYSPLPGPPQAFTNAPWASSSSFQTAASAQPPSPWSSGQSTSLGGGSPVSPAKAPLAILIGTYAGAVIGIVCGILSPGLTVTIIGWVCGGLLAFGFAMVYVFQNAKRQTNPFYQYTKGPVFVYGVGIGLSLIAILLCAARIALYVGRL